MSRRDAVMSEDEQLEIWFESLSEDEQAAVLSIDPEEDIPGWIVASLVAAHAALNEDPATDDAQDFKFRVPQVLQDFVRSKQSNQ